jgi:hypothetical protein
LVPPVWKGLMSPVWILVLAFFLCLGWPQPMNMYFCIFRSKGWFDLFSFVSQWGQEQCAFIWNRFVWWKHFQLYECCNIYTQISSWVNISRLVITFIASIIYKWNTAALSVSPRSSTCLMSLQGRKDPEPCWQQIKRKLNPSTPPDMAQLKFLSFMGGNRHILRQSNQVFIPNMSSSTFSLFAK